MLIQPDSIALEEDLQDLDEHDLSGKPPDTWRLNAPFGVRTMLYQGKR